MSVSIYDVMQCADYGHIVIGMSNGTNADAPTVWADHCSRCLAPLSRPQPNVDEARPS